VQSTSADRGSGITAKTPPRPFTQQCSICRCRWDCREARRQRSLAPCISWPLERRRAPKGLWEGLRRPGRLTEWWVCSTATSDRQIAAPCPPAPCPLPPLWLLPTPPQVATSACAAHLKAPDWRPGAGTPPCRLRCRRRAPPRAAASPATAAGAGQVRGRRRTGRGVEIEPCERRRPCKDADSSAGPACEAARQPGSQRREKVNGRQGTHLCE
jgi:hypothetical protein